MNNNSKIGGIHHITAIASSAAENLAFYENVLGLRLVKKTVNFDDPYTYHLYYGDQEGSPGTIMTFFPWEKLPRGKTGADIVTSIAFSIPIDSVDYWRKRLHDNGLVAEAHFDIDRTRWNISYGSTRFFEHIGMHLVFDLISFQVKIVAKK